MGSETENHALTLGLGFPSSPHPNPPLNSRPVKPPPIIKADTEPSLTLSLFPENYRPPERKVVVDDRPCSAASSLSNTAANTVVVSVKRERESASSDEMETERGCNSRGSDEDEDGSGPTATAATTRKKLRLTKDQSALLEESFKKHSTLNPKQKQALADRLNLRPRQVEVWFQNRRARTKLKQTEVDCEYLKKCCETLTDENRRLQKELEELKALKMAAHPLYMQLPAATLTMCPSCERIGAGVPIAAGKTTSSKRPFTKPHLFTSFPNPSAAC